MEKVPPSLPGTSTSAEYSTLPTSAQPMVPRASRRFQVLAPKAKQFFKAFIVVYSISFVVFHWRGIQHPVTPIRPRVPEYAEQILAECQAMNSLPEPASDFYERLESDRFVQGTPPTLILNATIWTGGRNGTEVVFGDLLLDKGLVQAVGYIPPAMRAKLEDDAVIVNADGAWVTPGLFDMHSHIGVGSAPLMRGNFDLSSSKGPIQPWDRSIDGINVHDESFKLSIAGGVTSSLVLPGSENAIGGEAFALKLRQTKENSPSSKVLEMPILPHDAAYNSSLPPRWRHIKHAVGENPSIAYQQTRLDTAWQYRQAYHEAQKIKGQQDSYCVKAEQGLWNEIPEQIPQSFEWEALIDVLRGRVKVNVHCYTATDFDAMVRLSNEFRFHISAFHHAHQAFFLTDLLKKTYGGKPALALFAVLGKFKIEAYRGSEHAPRILTEKGFKVVMKSDHAVIDSRHLIHEAAQAHYYGLHPAFALASVTTTPAEVAGYGHRLGFIRENYDADIVVWDSHPLALGATPKQVFIDGIPQLESPHPLKKPDTFQTIPRTPNFDDEAKKALAYQGLVPLGPRESRKGSTVTIFSNVTSLWRKEGSVVQNLFSGLSSPGQGGVVVVEKGSITCAGVQSACLGTGTGPDTSTVDLQGGSIAPGLTAFGSPLGLEEIASEPSTNDGVVYNTPGSTRNPEGMGLRSSLAQAVDGLSFGGRDTLQAYHAGVTTAVTAPVSSGNILGLSTAFRAGSSGKLEPGAVVQKVAALHVTIGHLGVGAILGGGGDPSVGTQIATLRSLLLGKGEGDIGAWFSRAAKGELPFVVNVAKVDYMATLIMLKREVEDVIGGKMRMVFGVATEAHLLAKEISDAKIGVILFPSRPFPLSWDQRRILPGPPLTRQTAFTTLMQHGVTVGLGTTDNCLARNIRFDLGWTSLDANGTISQQQAMALATTNLDELLGLPVKPSLAEDLVAYEGGGVFDFSSKVVGVISEERGLVDIF